MSDPFEALWEPVRPVAPDPLFAAHLRARLARALALPKGVIVSNLTLDLDVGPEPVPAAADTTPAPEPAVVPYLIVADARRALDWYEAHLGARRRGEPLVMADGRIGHAELDLSGSPIFLADEPPAGQAPDSQVAAPRPDERVPVSLTLAVADLDQLLDTAVSGGATLERPPATHPYGRNAVLRDPFGHRWIVAGPLPVAVPEDRADPVAVPEDRADPVAVPEDRADPSPSAGPVGGDGGEGGGEAAAVSTVAYVSLWLSDGDRAADFFGDVLGWRYEPARGDGRQVAGQSLPHGLFGGHEHATLFLCYAVADLDAAGERVRAAGGVADPPSVEPYGRISGCTDDQGARFALIEATPGSPRPVDERQGDVAYITMEVADSTKARAFYGSVMGWRFRPGRVEDGWNIDNLTPMAGMRGGQARATNVPMYRVDDLAAAVERVRARAGTATDPARQPYGLTSDCADDQGTRFYLGQF